VSATIENLRGLGALSPLDEHLGRSLSRLARENRPEVALAAALASRQVGEGHICLDLRRLVESPVVVDREGDPIAGVVWPGLENWLEALRSSPLVSDGGAHTPLVMDRQGRLYLRRYWEHEQRVARAIAIRANEVHTDIDLQTLRAGLERMFPEPPAGGAPDWQRLAAALAVRQRLCVISGGPGTGKTFTVAKILALLVEQALALGRPVPRMTLLAPTGKAAMRLAQSIQRAKANLSCSDAVKDAIPDLAATIHRGLGASRSATDFYYNRGTTLLTDVVVVDEASMVDLGLMSRLLQAMPPAARLILLGDKDQLASVEAGAVLGDICNTGEMHAYSEPLIAWLNQAAGQGIARQQGAPGGKGIWDCIVYLTHSYRYGPASPIGTLARAVNAGDIESALSALAAGPEVVLLPAAPEGRMNPALLQTLVRGYRPFCIAAQAAERLQRLETFRVLCAHRKGRQGVEVLNREIEEVLEEKGLLRRGGSNYAGRPIIIMRNDYQVGLFNGDVGVIDEEVDEEGRRAAVFLGTQGQFRRISPSRLPPHETVFAMSVHKSQGSEFDEVALVLPERASPVLSRELLYTAVTRARQRVIIQANREVFEQAVARRIQRSSGLRDALWS
jgi:exodeoxyribonuclease V alpha subunit